jgi:hypothetical protein
MKNSFKNEKTIGFLLIVGGVLLFIPYTILTIIFDYPDILRQETGVILSKFKQGGNFLIFNWLAFALVGLPLIPAYILLGQKLENQLLYIRWVTVVGVIGLVVQMIGLLRWVFVVPILALHFQNGDDTTRAVVKIAFEVVHQYGGVILGEHLGQLFTIIWTIMISHTFAKLKLMPQWLNIWAYLASGIYFIAQAELLATVIPDFPVWSLAGFLGSTMWLVWLIIVGIRFQINPIPLSKF